MLKKLNNTVWVKKELVSQTEPHRRKQFKVGFCRLSSSKARLTGNKEIKKLDHCLPPANYRLNKLLLSKQSFRERERECVCMCLCVCEREREKEREVKLR